MLQLLINLARCDSSGATPGTRVFANESPKQLVKMGLVCQSASRRDLSEGHFRGQHQSLSVLHTPAHQVAVWRVT
jgi:hypothetical protein